MVSRLRRGSEGSAADRVKAPSHPILVLSTCAGGVWWVWGGSGAPGTITTPRPFCHKPWVGGPLLALVYLTCEIRERALTEQAHVVQLVRPRALLGQLSTGVRRRWGRRRAGALKPLNDPGEALSTWWGGLIA